MITRLAQQIGGAFGTALLAVILAAATAAGSPNVGHPTHGFHVAFWWAVGFTAVAVLIGAFLPPRAAGASTPAGPALEDQTP